MFYRFKKQKKLQQIFFTEFFLNQKKICQIFFLKKNFYNTILQINILQIKILQIKILQKNVHQANFFDDLLTKYIFHWRIFFG